MKNFPSQLKRIKKKIQTEEQGMIVVEATISFMVFLMVVIAIIYLTNIFIVHNKVQFAINSTAHQLSDIRCQKSGAARESGRKQIYKADRRDSRTGH